MSPPRVVSDLLDTFLRQIWSRFKTYFDAAPHCADVTHRLKVFQKEDKKTWSMKSNWMHEVSTKRSNPDSPRFFSCWKGLGAGPSTSKISSSWLRTSRVLNAPQTTQTHDRLLTPSAPHHHIKPTAAACDMEMHVSMLQGVCKRAIHE